jgi:hypothetical protein
VQARGGLLVLHQTLSGSADRGARRAIAAAPTAIATSPIFFTGLADRPDYLAEPDGVSDCLFTDCVAFLSKAASLDVA